MFVCENISVNSKGHLCFAGQDTVELAEKYGAPLYLYDEERLRFNIRKYKNALREAFGDRADVLFASKAASFRQIYRIASEEDIGIDAVSPGEIYTASSAGFDMSRAFFHGNAKTDEDIRYGIKEKIGYFVTDNLDELYALDRIAGEESVCQKLVLRITPGIDTHTYEAVNTGKVDSKFGCAIETGQAEELLLAAIKCKNVKVCGFHCHVGSQVFGEDVFERAAAIMLAFIADMQKKHGFVSEILDLGGGYGVRYVDSDPYLDIPAKIASVAAAIKKSCAELGIAVPFICLEPGRGIVADAGMTLYRAQSVKRIPGYKNYVAIDGGMTDNPRFALYKSKYTVLPADNMNADRPFICTVAGRCCESGDLIQEGVALPDSTGRGSLIAVCTTGAYNYSMSSNYNRVARPPVIMLTSAAGSYVAVARETFADIAKNDI